METGKNNIDRKNLMLRVVVSIIGIPLLLASFVIKGYFFMVISSVISIICVYELLMIFEKKNLFPLKILFSILSCLSVILFYINYIDVKIIISSIAFFSMLIEIFRNSNKQNIFNVFVETFSVLYIVIPLLLLIEISSLPGFNFIIFIFILIWTCDTSAYFTGKYLGKHQLTSVSPKKTIEGSIGGLLFTVVACLIYYYFSPVHCNIFDCIVIGTIVGILGQIGDLFESFIKRQCNVKESSGILPGHGGMLDRFDSLIFIVPLIYFYLFYLRKLF